MSVYHGFSMLLLLMVLTYSILNYLDRKVINGDLYEGKAFHILLWTLTPLNFSFFASVENGSIEDPSDLLLIFTFLFMSWFLYKMYVFMKRSPPRG